jgi:hypothetical protein
MLQHGTYGFISPLKNGVLRTSIVPKSPSPSAGSQPANLGSNGKHAKHYTTDDELVKLTNCGFKNIK